MILKARYVIPVCRACAAAGGPVIENGVVEVRESRIVDVHRASAREGGTTVVDCGDSILLPGFVNAHTHLELTHLAGKVPPVPGAGPADFADWLRRLLCEMRKTRDDPEAVAASVNDGAARCLQAGVTTVGDVTRLPHLTRPVLRDGRLRVVSFGEVIAIGALRDALRARLEAAVDTAHDTDRLRAAVSPHAPYTCDRWAIRACKQAAAESEMRLCMHLAETPEEAVCVLTGSGPLVDFLRSVGVWDESVRPPGLRPMEYVDELGLLSARTLFAHVNYVTDAELERLARSGAHVAYCPRTHAAFDHAPHRFREMLAAGVNVCIGTDSLASNPSLSILDELRYLRSTFNDVDDAALIEMGTLRGAEALGMGDTVGSLEPGKQADVVVVPLQPGGDRDPLANLLRSALTPAQVYVAGQRAGPDGGG